MTPAPAGPTEFASARHRVLPEITRELKGKIDRVWDAFWSVGTSNSLEVIE